MEILPIILTIVPGMEARTAIPTALVLYNVDPLTLFITLTSLNLLVILITFTFLDTIIPPLREKSEKFNSFIEWFREKRYRKWELLSLLVFVSIPIPGAGGYSGSLIAYLFGLDKKKSAVIISVGIIIGTFLATIGALSGIRLFS